MSGRRRYSTEELLERLREAVEELGTGLTLDEFCRHAGVSVRPIATRFGCWSAFRKQAGLSPRAPGNAKLRRYTREGLVESLRGLARECGDGVTLADFCRRTGVSPSTVYGRCESWSKLREAAGLRDRKWGNPRARRRTPEEIRSRLENVARKQGVDVTLTEFTAATGISATTVYAHFGSWPNLRRAADLPEQGRPRNRYSDDYLMREVHRVVRLEGRFPSVEEYRRHGRVNQQTLLQRCGGAWRDVEWAYERWCDAQRNPMRMLSEPLSEEEYLRLLDGKSG